MAGVLVEVGGESRFEVPPARLFEALTDPAMMVKLIPDVESYTTNGTDTIDCVVRPGFSFLRGTLKLKVVFTEIHPPEESVAGWATMRVVSQGIGATMELESRMEIQALPEGAVLKWQAQVTKLQGLIATVSRSLIQAAAGRIAEQTWEKLRRDLQTPETTE